jgi:hypothetical protein
MVIFAPYHTRWTIFGGTPLDEGSAQRRGPYVTTHRTQKRQISLLPAEFEPQTYTLDLAIRPVACIVKADSHIACRAHAVTLPRRTAKGLERVCPTWFTQCGRVWFTLAMSRPCPPPTMPFFSRPRHRTAVERWPVGDGAAFGFFLQSRGVPRRFLSEAYQSQMQVAIVKQNNVCHGRGKEW